VECPTPVARDEFGKLPYGVQQWAPKDRRRHLQTFAGATAESFGNGSSLAFRAQKQHSRLNDNRSSKNDDGSRYSVSVVGDSDDLEV
jgi:hypothetical protein